MIFIERKDATTDTAFSLAARFHAIETEAFNRRQEATGAHERELCGYAATFRECALRLSYYGHTPADLAEVVAMFATTTVARLTRAGFDPLRHRDAPALLDFWRDHGRLNACRTVLEILAGAQS